MQEIKKIIYNLNRQKIKLISESNFFILQDGLNFSSETLLHYNYSRRLVTKSTFKYNFGGGFSKLKLKFPCFILYTNDNNFLTNYFFNCLFNASVTTNLVIKNFNIIFYKVDFLSKKFFDYFSIFSTFFFIMSFYQYSLLINGILSSKYPSTKKDLFYEID